mgnify:CR=1 FL=1
MKFEKINDDKIRIKPQSTDCNIFLFIFYRKFLCNSFVSLGITRKLLRCSLKFLFSFLDSTDADTIPVRFREHIAYALSFRSNAVRTDAVFFD